MLKIELTNTDAGLIAIQRAIAGDDITFTKLVIGDGIITDSDISNLIDVVNEIKSFPLGVVKPEAEEMLRVRSNINNVGLTEDKIIREYGLFAKFGNEQEFLFAYLNSGESTTPLPKASGGRYDLNRDFVLFAGNNTNVSFDTNGDLVYSTLNDLKALDVQKENKIATKYSAFNKDFGTLTGTVLEGAKLAETLGLEYGGIVNNSSAKTAGKAYYCTANKAIYKCTQNTSLNYIDANYFEGLSNDKLLGKLQNLSNYNYIVFNNKRFENANLLLEEGSFQFYRVGYIVFIEFQGYYTKKTSNKGILLTLPEIIPLDFRPRTKKNDNVVSSYESLTNELIFNPNGDITFGNGSTSASSKARDWLMFSMSYTIL